MFRPSHTVLVTLVLLAAFGGPHTSASGTEVQAQLEKITAKPEMNSSDKVPITTSDTRIHAILPNNTTEQTGLEITGKNIETPIASEKSASTTMKSISEPKIPEEITPSSPNLAHTTVSKSIAENSTVVGIPDKRTNANERRSTTLKPMAENTTIIVEITDKVNIAITSTASSSIVENTTVAGITDKGTNKKTSTVSGSIQNIQITGTITASIDYLDQMQLWSELNAKWLKLKASVEAMGSKSYLERKVLLEAEVNKLFEPDVGLDFKCDVKTFKNASRCVCKAFIYILDLHINLIFESKQLVKNVTDSEFSCTGIRRPTTTTFPSTPDHLADNQAKAATKAKSKGAITTSPNLKISKFKKENARSTGAKVAFFVILFAAVVILGGLAYQNVMKRNPHWTGFGTQLALTRSNFRGWYANLRERGTFTRNRSGPGNDGETELLNEYELL